MYQKHVFYHVIKIKRKNFMVIFVDTEKTFDKKSTEIHNNNKTHSKLIIEMNLFLWIKSVCFLFVCFIYLFF